MDTHMNAKKIAIGAAIGGAVGCIAVALLSSKNANSVKAKCGGYGDKLKSFVNEVSSNISENINETTGSMTDKAYDLIESVKKEIGEFPDFDNKDFIKGLIVGGVLGGLLGSGTTLLCNGNVPSNWKAMAKNVLQLLETTGLSKQQAAGHCKITDNILDFTAAGIQLWKKIKK